MGVGVGVVGAGDGQLFPFQSHPRSSLSQSDMKVHMQSLSLKMDLSSSPVSPNGVKMERVEEGVQGDRGKQ